MKLHVYVDIWLILLKEVFKTIQVCNWVCKNKWDYAILNGFFVEYSAWLLPLLFIFFTFVLVCKTPALSLVQMIVAYRYNFGRGTSWGINLFSRKATMWF